MLDGFSDPRITFRFAVDDRFRCAQPRDALEGRRHARQLRHALIELDRHRRVFEIPRHAAVRVAGEIELEIERAAPLQITHIDAGLAQPLHRGQAHHDARPLDAGLVAARATMTVAPAAGREIDALLAPFARERAHVFCRNTCLFLLPFRRLRSAVLLAEEIGLPLIEPDRVRLHVFLVIEVFLDPDVSDRHRHRDGSRGPGREPLARQELRRRVVVWIDVHDLYAELRVLQPLPANGPFLRAIRAARALGISGPEHDHVAVLQAVLDCAVGLRLADAKRVSPMVHIAPVPAFPAVGIMMDLRVTDSVAEAEQRGEVVTDIAPGVVRTVRYRHHAGTVGTLEPFDFAGDEIERFLPRDAHITRLATV